MGTLAWHPFIQKVQKKQKWSLKYLERHGEKCLKWASSVDSVSHPLTHEDTAKASWIYDIICDPAEVHAGPCKSLALPWWMTLTVIKSPANPCSVWQSCLGANEGFQEPSHATQWCFCTDTHEIVCVKCAGGHILTPCTRPHDSFLFTLPARYLWPAICQSRFNTEAHASRKNVLL